jgi:hypothetical protein
VRCYACHRSVVPCDFRYDGKAAQRHPGTERARELHNGEFRHPRMRFQVAWGEFAGSQQFAIDIRATA